MNDWQHAQQQDEQELQERILQALEASQSRPLTKDEAMLLAWSSGCATEFFKETRA